jgi:hypothetical protein
MNLPCTIKIGPVIITFLCPTRQWLALLERNYKPFILKTGTPGSICVTILAKTQPELFIKGIQVEKAGNTWRIARHDFHSLSSNNFKNTVLTANRNKYTIDSWLRVFFTLCGTKFGAMLLHGSAYSAHGGVFVFAGRSGKGKSTIIKILGKSRALTDELVCVYKHANKYFAASTPFWGELKKGEGRIYRGKINKLLFIEHGCGTYLQNVSHGQALKNILQTTLFFSKYKKHVDYIFSSAFALSKNIPCNTFAFEKQSNKNDILYIIGRPANEKSS